MNQNQESPLDNDGTAYQTVRSYIASNNLDQQINSLNIVNQPTPTGSLVSRITSLEPRATPYITYPSEGSNFTVTFDNSWYPNSINSFENSTEYRWKYTTVNSPDEIKEEDQGYSFFKHLTIKRD